MSKRQYEIECGRCGATKLDAITEAESSGIIDRTGPVFRVCERCGKTTGWIKARGGAATVGKMIASEAPTE